MQRERERAGEAEMGGVEHKEHEEDALEYGGWMAKDERQNATIKKKLDLLERNMRGEWQEC